MNLEEYLDGLASLHGKALNATAARIFLDALSGYPEQAVLHALSRCTRELKTFPTIAEVISRIDDGHLDVEQAWALVPKTEAETAVWTEEIKSAFYACCSLIDEDLVAARMAFKEAYTKALLEARSNRKPPLWCVTLGHDKSRQIRSLEEAVRTGRITATEAQAVLPDMAFRDPTTVKQVTAGPTQMKNILENKK